MVNDSYSKDIVHPHSSHAGHINTPTLTALSPLCWSQWTGRALSPGRNGTCPCEGKSHGSVCPPRRPISESRSHGRGPSHKNHQPAGSTTLPALWFAGERERVWERPALIPQRHRSECKHHLEGVLWFVVRSGESINLWHAENHSCKITLDEAVGIVHPKLKCCHLLLTYMSPALSRVFEFEDNSYFYVILQ